MTEFTIQPSPTRTSHLGHSDVPGYSYGQWNPGISFGDVSTGIAYAFQFGQFVQFGDVCLAQFQLTMSNKGSASGNAKLTDLPFNVKDSGAVGNGVIGEWNGMASTIAYMSLRAFLGENTAFVMGTTSATASLNALQDTHFLNGSELFGTMVYVIDR